jgi:hypothetical protein
MAIRERRRKISLDMISPMQDARANRHARTNRSVIPSAENYFLTPIDQREPSNPLNRESISRRNPSPTSKIIR